MRHYLTRRGGTYWFRRRVPESLASRLDRREIYRSLRTTSARVAAWRANQAWLALEALFNTMHDKPTLTDRQARLLLDQLLNEPLLVSPAADEVVDDFLNGSGGLAKLLLNRSAADMVLTYPDREQTHLTQHFVRIADRLGEGVARLGQGVSDAKLVLARHDTETARARAQDAEEKLVTSRVDLEVARQLGQMAKPEPRTDTLPDAVHGGEIQQTIRSSKEPTTKACIGKKLRFSTVETLFLADKAIGDKSYTEQTKNQIRVTFRLLVELIGDKPVVEYTGIHAGEFRTLLLRIPASHGKGGRVNAVEAIRKADAYEAASGLKVSRMSLKTAKRHFSALSQVWQWLIPRGHVEKNVFRGFEFPGTKTSKRKRDDWSEEDLIKLFSSSCYQPQVDQDAAMRWFSIIAAYSGLRLEEIARLRTNLDIVELEGVLAFKIQEHQETPRWSPKSEAGERIVPVHPLLIELGLASLVERRRKQGVSRLFPELRQTGPDQKFSAEISRKFSKVRKVIGIGPKTVFHSHRHSVRTILGNTDFKDSWIDAILGHESGEGSIGITTYLKRIGIKNLERVICSIEYSDRVTEIIRRAMSK